MTVERERPGAERGDFREEVPLLYVLADSSPDGSEPLFLPSAHGPVLPVFSFMDEARLFLRFEAPRGGWRIEARDVLELHSALLGSCPTFWQVVLDPLPTTLAGESYGSTPMSLTDLDRLVSRSAPGETS